MASKMTVDELIERWRTFPSNESDSALHADYARAIGLKGSAAARAVKYLAPYAKSENRDIRQGALEGLAGIGEEGLGPILDALNHRGTSYTDGQIRWDAADAIAGMGETASSAVPALGRRLVDWEENFNVKLACVEALKAIGPASTPALTNAREAYYAHGELPMDEAAVLRSINETLVDLTAKAEADASSGTPAEEEGGEVETRERPVERPDEGTEDHSERIIEADN
jgi:HEAT repeat protein